MNKNQSRSEQIYKYPLYSLKRFPTFFRYCKSLSKEIAKENGGGHLQEVIVLADMLWCNFRYGVMDSREYQHFHFWKKPHSQRKQYFTKRMYFKLIKSFDYEIFSRLIEKQNQYKEYSSFINRRWMVVDDACLKIDLYRFVEELGEVIAKPSSSDCGNGIERLTAENRDAIERIYSGRHSTKYLVEEVIKNCQELEALNPYSLNTVRITYVLDSKSEPHIFSIMLRTGASSKAVVDNWGAGGILMDVSINKGIVDKPGLDEQGNEYEIHPITKKKIVGFMIPRFDELVNFARKVASVNKKVIYGGLDIAITDNSFELIEINFPPANIGYQSFGKGYLDDICKVNKYNN